MQGKLDLAEHNFDIKAESQGNAISVTVGDKTFVVKLEKQEQGYQVRVGEDSLEIGITPEQKEELRLLQTSNLLIDGHVTPTLFRPQREKRQEASLLGNGGEHGEGSVMALMPGTVIKILVEEGQEVAADEVLLILEAMKMENEIKAPTSGVISSIPVTEGQPITKGELLLAITPASEEK